MNHINAQFSDNRFAPRHVLYIPIASKYANPYKYWTFVGLIGRKYGPILPSSREEIVLKSLLPIPRPHPKSRHFFATSDKNAVQSPPNALPHWLSRRQSSNRPLAHGHVCRATEKSVSKAFSNWFLRVKNSSGKEAIHCSFFAFVVERTKCRHNTGFMAQGY